MLRMIHCMAFIIWITYETTSCTALECEDGYSLLVQNATRNNTCLQCPNGCLNCTHHPFDSFFTNCSSCFDGYFKEDDNNKTVICKECSFGCRTCINSWGSCRECVDGYVFVFGACNPLFGIIVLVLAFMAVAAVVTTLVTVIINLIREWYEKRRAARHTEDTIPVSRKVKYDKLKQDNVEMALLGTNRDTKQVFSKPQYEESEQDTVEMPLLGEKGDGHMTLASQESRINIGYEIKRWISLKKDKEIQDDLELITILIDNFNNPCGKSPRPISAENDSPTLADIHNNPVTCYEHDIPIGKSSTREMNSPAVERGPEIQHITITNSEKGARNQAYIEMADTNKQVITDKITPIQEVREPVFKIYPPNKQQPKSSLKVGIPSQSFTNAAEPIVTPTCNDSLPVYKHNQVHNDYFKVAMNAFLTEKRRWKSTSDLTSNPWSIRTKFNKSNQTIGCLEDMSLEQVDLIFGSQSEELNNKCQSIVHSLTTITGVKRVWPSYKTSNKASLVLLVLIEPEMDRRALLLPYPLRLKSVNSKNDENVNVESSEVYVNAFLSDEDMDKLNNVFDRVALDLLNVHSNLCAILISPLKSRQTGTELIETPCFVLFVYMKGLIPINEREFPEFIDGIPTDVRDGIFSVFGASKAKEFHNPLLKGCMLSRFDIQFGTIGPFLTDQNGKTFCITSAHVLLSPPEYKLLQTKRKMNENDLQNGHSFNLDVYQPTRTDNIGNTYKPFGQIRSVIYNDGWPHTAGVEVGLVEITDPQRTPITGEFPEGQFDDEGFTKDNPLKFKNGLMVDKNTCTVDRTEVFKYGCETGITSGTFKRSGRNVYRDTLTEGLTITLCNQIQINSTGNTKFAEPGDSGALVLVPNNAKECDMRAVGIVTGGMNNTVSVTPIWDILDGFNQPLLDLKKF